ncbi:hypothetical protein HY837_03325 [archaeon]|nr:hypothetical protein [archaeon]
MKKIIILFVSVLLCLFVVNAQSLGLNCGPGGKCDPGLFCNDMNMKCCDSTTGSCTAPQQPPQQTTTPHTQQPSTIEKIMPPPPQPPTTQLPPSFIESYCGDGRLDSSREQCDGSSQEEANTACPLGYFCTKECQCKAESLTSAPAQCPEETIPVKEGDMLYCYRIPQTKEPVLSSQSCTPKVFYIPAGEKKTELRFSLPWIPEKAELTKGSKVIPVNFEGQELVLALEEGDYLMSVYKDGEKNDLPVKVLKSSPEEQKKVEAPEKIMPPIDAEIVVHAQNDDEDQGKMLTAYLKNLGMNAVFSDARNVEAVSSAKTIIFLGGYLANNLVGKYFPDMSESLYNLNSNRFVKQAGNQFVMALAGWCGDATKEAAEELSNEMSYELELSDKEEKTKDARDVLKSTTKKIGSKKVCMPEAPELLENLKSGRKVICPNEQLCESVCGLKELELYANDQAYNDFGVSSRKTANWNGRECSCTIYYEAKSKETILYHNSRMPINVERYCAKKGITSLREDIREAEENAKQKSSQRYAEANIVGKTKIINDILSQRSCDGNAACKEYCKYELTQCKNGRRNRDFQRKGGEKPYYDYPSNACAGYNKVNAAYDPRDASCSCNFFGDEYEYGIDPDYMNPSMVNYFCERAESTQEIPEQRPVKKIMPPPPQPPTTQPSTPAEQPSDLPAPRGRDISNTQPATELCSAEEVCKYQCALKLKSNNQGFNEYNYRLENSACYCTLLLKHGDETDQTSPLNPIAPSEIQKYTRDARLCTKLRSTAQSALSEMGLIHNAG